MKRIQKRWIYGAVSIVLLFLAYVFTQPRWIFALAAEIKPGAIYAVEPTVIPGSEYEDEVVEKVVALSIDDGPSLATNDILTTIDRYGAKATFFNISENVPGREELVQRTVEQGHELGNHMTADEPSIRMNAETFEADLQVAQTALIPFLPTGDRMKWLRPGMGFYNAQMVSTAERYGYQLVLGSNFPYDTHVPSSWFASTFILNTVRPGDIIVLHDGEERGERTVVTLEKVLSVLQARGYEVVTISDLVGD